MTRKPRTKAWKPWMPTAYDDKIVMAFKALAEGRASEGQQILALRWLVHESCLTYDHMFHPSGDRESSYLNGRRHVGLEINKLINMPPEQLINLKRKL